MSTRSLRARLERLQAGAGDDDYVIGQDRDRDRKRRQQLIRLKLDPGLTEAQTAELAALEVCLKDEIRDAQRSWELFCKRFETGLTDAERIEEAELRERYPADPNDPLRERFREMAEVFGAIAGITDDDGARNANNSMARPVQDSVISASNGASPTRRLAPNAAEKLKPTSPDIISDAELLEQLMLAANHNVVPGAAIEDVGPIRVMLQNGIVLDDVLYTLRQKVDRRIYPKNRALTSWSEHCFVLAVAEAYGRRVMLPVLKEKLKEKREALGKSA